MSNTCISGTIVWFFDLVHISALVLRTIRIENHVTSVSLCYLLPSTGYNDFIILLGT